MKRKSFKDISWNVSEKEYRADNALSYSTIAKFEREGFNKLDTLFEKVESPSLTYGLCVDTLITGSDEEFNNNFMVADIDNNLTDTMIVIVRKLYNTFKDKYHDVFEIPDNELLSAIEDISWNNHWLPKTRIKKIREDGVNYYKLLYIAGDKTIIDTNTYRDVLNAVEALKTSISTKWYFEENNAFDDSIERLYQLKFKHSYNGVDYRSMADEIIVLHDKKQVIPVDLKTSYHEEWDFPKSFLSWCYYQQSRLYWRLIRANMDKDSYFKDFELLDYRFIVVNRKTLTPLVWEYSDTKKTGTLIYGKNKDIIIRDPYDIGEELNYYLNKHSKTPIGINMYEPNNLVEYINKHF